MAGGIPGAAWGRQTERMVSRSDESMTVPVLLSAGAPMGYVSGRLLVTDDVLAGSVQAGKVEDDVVALRDAQEQAGEGHGGDLRSPPCSQSARTTRHRF